MDKRGRTKQLMNWKKVLLVILVVIVAAVSYGLYEYFRPNAKTVDLQPDVVITAVDLYNNYEENEDSANIHYLNKVIEVSGMVSDVKTDTSGIVVTIDGGNGMFGISCSLQKTDEEIMKPEKHTPITIRGICTGMLMDVVLTRCVIVPKATIDSKAP